MSAPELAEKLAHTLPEVADLTGVTLRRLKDGCLAKEIPHSVYRGQRVMTREQIARFLAANEIIPSGPVPEVSRIEEHRQRIGRRLARKARAA